MSLLQSIRALFTPDTQESRADEEAVLPVQDPNLVAAQEENQRLEAERQENERVARLQQAARIQEQANLDAKIDEILSDDPDKFLEQTEQPGGE